MFAVAVVAVTLLASPTPIVRLMTAHPIVAFAASAGSIAYLDGHDCRVRLGSRLAAVSESAFCAGDTLAVGGGQVAWGGFREVKCSDDYWIVATGPPGKVLEHRDYGCDGGGATPPSISGAADALYYSFVDYKETADCVDTGGKCVFAASGGTVVRLSGGRRTALRGVPPAALLAAAPGRIAIVRAAARYSSSPSTPKPSTYPLPAIGPLELRDGTTGRLLQSFPLSGVAEALAVSPSLVAVVVADHGTRTLRWYGSRNGSVVLGRTRVLALATSDKAVGVETGHDIRIFDAASGKQTAEWHVNGTPAGLSLDGGHVLWAETRAGRGRILDAQLP